MNNEDALKLFREMLENAKETTERYPHAFFLLFSDFTDDLRTISQHIQNENLRICSIQFWLLLQVFRGSFDYTFRNLVLEKLKASLEEEEEISMEVILDAASRYLSVTAISGIDGRDVVDMRSLRGEFDMGLEGLDESTKVFTILEVANAIREIYDSTSFIEESKEEMLEFYDKLIESTEKDWSEVYDTLREYLLKLDRRMLIWKRREV